MKFWVWKNALSAFKMTEEHSNLTTQVDSRELQKQSREEEEDEAF